MSSRSASAGSATATGVWTSALSWSAASAAGWGPPLRASSSAASEAAKASSDVGVGDGCGAGEACWGQGMVVGGWVESGVGFTRSAIRAQVHTSRWLVRVRAWARVWPQDAGGSSHLGLGGQHGARGRKQRLRDSDHPQRSAARAAAARRRDGPRGCELRQHMMRHPGGGGDGGGGGGGGGGGDVGGGGSRSGARRGEGEQASLGEGEWRSGSRLVVSGEGSGGGSGERVTQLGQSGLEREDVRAVGWEIRARVSVEVRV